MNIILKSFIENMFSQLPETEEMKRLKDSLASDMQEKYLAYKTEGKSENESVGLVISEFGSIDEILEAYDIDIEKNTVDELKRQEAFDIIGKYKKFSHLIGIAIGLIIIFVGLFISLLLLLQNVFSESEYIYAIAPMILILSIAPCVGTLVYSGIRLSPLAKRLESTFTLSSLTRNEIVKEQELFQDKYALNITMGVILCVFGLGLIALGFSIEELMYYVPLVGFSLIASGIYLFVTTGNLYSIYHRITQKSKEKASNLKSEKVIEIVAPIYWCIVVAIYLAISFIWNQWHISWVIYPVMGVIFGAVVSIIEAVYRKNSDE